MDRINVSEPKKGDIKPLNGKMFIWAIKSNVLDLIHQCVESYNKWYPKVNMYTIF